MRYKILLTGSDQKVIDYFFDRLADDFDILSTSSRINDFTKHVEVFEPHLILFCMSRDSNNEFKSDFESLEELLHRNPRANTLFGILSCPITANPYYRRIIDSVAFNIMEPLNYSGLKQELSLFLISKIELAKEEKEEEPVKTSQEFVSDDEKKSILVIDDDPTILKLMRDYLLFKYDVAVARSGEAAYRYLEAHHTDLILIDYDMPGEKGPSVLWNIRKMHSLEAVPALFLTGVTEREAIAEAAKVHPQGYLLKPVKRELLLGKIKEILD